MKTIKIIDLLNALYRVNNGSKEMIPKKIKYDGLEFIFDNNYKRYVRGEETLGDYTSLDIYLNEEVEIIEEEKEIEKIPYHYNFGYIDCGDLKIEVVEELSKNFNYFADKINELIDAVNELRKDK